MIILSYAMNMQDSRGLFTIFLELLLLFFVVSSLWRGRRTQTRKAPPEAGGAWPLIGHLHLLGGPQPPHVTLGNMADKYGPIFTLRLGVHKTLVVSNWEMAKQCFTVNDKAFADRPKSVAFEVLGYNYSLIGFSRYGSYWRQVRKIATSELLTAHRIETLKDVIESEVKAAVKECYSVWLNSRKSGSPKAETEMKTWFGDIIMNVMFRAVVGKRFDGENERIRKLVTDFFNLSDSFAISDALPYLRWLGLDGKEKKMKRAAKELDGFYQAWLEEHKRNRKCGLNAGKDLDLMDVLLGVVGDAEDYHGRDADTTTKASLILAGVDTTTGTLTWVLSLLLNNREILNKTIHELDTEIGKEKMVEISDLKKLNYVSSVIKETLRLYPAGPLSVPHESMEDCIVGGYHVPTGTRLLANISKLQRDPLFVDDEEQVRRVRRVLRDFFRLIGYSVIGDAIPFLGWLDLGGAVKEMKKTAIEMDRIVSEWLKEHRQRRDSDETETLKDFIDVLLPALDGVDHAGYDADTVIKATCSTLIASAIDTTTITMIWALSLMLNNRHVLERVQEELDEHIGKERLVNESDINKLEYLQAVVKETLRLYPAAPLLGVREFSKDCILGGYHIRAGTRFIFNAWKLHRDPGVWSNPLEFQPQRFLTTHKDVDVKGQHFELIPFGAGRRACPGIPFGIQMTLLALAAFLQAFEITTPNNAQVDMSATFGLTVIKTTPLEVLVRPRLPYQLLSEW
ncbi:hypothetical protein Fmac_000365 [Flemingia macrophylla]|uniref:Cytochrome P450 n=1 Tax=Flemingia macrophylla TaxID=520843 RepID=A0ABD1NE27_9FABA